jgi:hypothetical protein
VWERKNGAAPISKAMQEATDDEHARQQGLGVGSRADDCQRTADRIATPLYRDFSA